jgi:uncharacterized protein YjbI with pentapeptide repeats
MLQREAYRGQRSRWLDLAGCVLVLAYALPLLAPPATSTAAVGTGFFARLFPGVPAWWVVTRLACLALGVTFLARGAARPAFTTTRRDASGLSDVSGISSRAAQAVALLIAGVHALSSFWVAQFSTAGQTAYFLALALPAVVLAAGGRAHARAGRSHLDATAWMVVGLATAWMLLRLTDAWHSPRAADAVDMWRTFGYLARFTQSGGNFLTDSMDPELPGITAVPLFFQGLSLLRALEITPTLAWVQVAHALWLALCALGVAALAGVLLGATTAPIAAAVFLWAPFTLIGPLNPSTVFFGPLLTAALALLALAFHRRRSLAAVAAFGAVAGVAITYPALVPVTLLAGLVVAWSWRGGRDVPPLIAAIAALSFLAACVPALPTADEVRAMWTTYAIPSGQIAVLQDVLFGQIPSVRGATTALGGTRPSVLDVPIATLLSPVAVARTPVRLWGDVLFDPLGGALCALGVAVSIRNARRDPTCALLLVALTAALLPGLISSYDQPSLLRVFALPVPVAVLAALGFSTLAASVLRESSRLAIAAVTGAIAVGGTYVFDVVNPNILRSSAFGLAIRSLRFDDLGRTAVVTATDENPKYLYLDTIASEVPVRPIPVLSADESDAIMAGARPAPDLLLWTPAVEETGRISFRVCQHWKAAALYAITDRTGATRLNAARPLGHGWIPALPRAQWTVESCTPGSSPDTANAAPVKPTLVKPDEVVPFDLKGRDFTGADLSGRDLRSERLAGAILRGAKLAGANLAGADLRFAVLAEADLTSANLGGARLGKADLSGAVLRNANAHGADLVEATLANADLSDADFATAALGGADLRGARFARTKLDGAKLIGAKLSKADLSGAQVATANFRGAALYDVNLQGLDLQAGDLSDADLHGARLARADLSGLILRNVSFEGADLSEARLARADLGGAKLAGAKLAGADLTRERLAGAELVRADLSRAVLREAELSGADLSGAKLPAADLTGATLTGAKLDGLTLSDATLTGVTLTAVKMPNAKLSGTNLAGADLRDCDLRNADLSKADLQRAMLGGCDLTGAVFTEAKLAAVDLRGAVLDEADLSGADLANADLGGQRLRKAKLASAKLTAANLAQADLAGADLSGANASQATLAGANLTNANLRRADLNGAMISGADATNADLRGANLDRAYLIGVTWSHTQCPDETMSNDHDETCCEHHAGAAPAACSR